MYSANIHKYVISLQIKHNFQILAATRSQSPSYSLASVYKISNADDNLWTGWDNGVLDVGDPPLPFDSVGSGCDYYIGYKKNDDWVSVHLIFNIWVME